MGVDVKTLSRCNFCRSANLILVLLGTNPYPFNRLIDEVVRYADKTGENIVVQSGNTDVSSQAVHVSKYIEHDKLLEYIASADIVIAQGGFGSLQDCIKLAAHTVAVPRLQSLGESVDDQTEIVDALASEGLVIPLYDVSELESAIKLARALNINSEASSQLPLHIANTVTKLLGK